MPAPKDPIKRQEWINKISKNVTKLWEDPEYALKQSNERKTRTYSEEAVDKRLATMESRYGTKSAMSGKTHTEEAKEKNREAHIGKKPTQETLDKQSRSMLENFENGYEVWNKGLTKDIEPKLAHTEESKAKISKKHIGKVLSQEHKDKLSDSHLGQVSWLKGLTKETDSRVMEMSIRNTGKTVSEETKDKIRIKVIEQLKNGNSKSKNTKPELEAKKIFEKCGIDFQHQFEVGKRLFDFYLPDFNILVEVDGTYWHGKGIKDEDLKYGVQKEIRNNDKFKNRLAIKSNYILFRVWEDELKCLESFCKNLVEDYV